MRATVSAWNYIYLRTFIPLEPFIISKYESKFVWFTVCAKLREEEYLLVVLRPDLGVKEIKAVPKSDIVGSVN